MQVSILSFTLRGAELSNRISEKLSQDVVVICNTTNERAENLVDRTKLSLHNWTKMQFDNSGVVVFIGACGIAVRAIAPFIADKRKDPAVLVIDDCGNHVISLLSGHLGNANAWAKKVAELIGAEPVITTASDNHGKLAFDLFAKRNALFITEMKMAKILESAYLDGEKIGFLSDLPYGELPDGISEVTDGKYGIYIGYDRLKAKRFEQTLWLIPENIVAGIGCRKGKDKSSILCVIRNAFEKVNVPVEALCGITSIDLKKEEKGILDIINDWDKKLFCEFYSADELKTVSESKSQSAFVEKITGVDNVCERAAILAAGENGELILEKQISDGVTVALAKMKRRIHFE